MMFLWQGFSQHNQHHCYALPLQSKGTITVSQYPQCPAVKLKMSSNGSHTKGGRTKSCCWLLLSLCPCSTAPPERAMSLPCQLKAPSHIQTHLKCSLKTENVQQLFSHKRSQDRKLACIFSRQPLNRTTNPGATSVLSTKHISMFPNPLQSPALAPIQKVPGQTSACPCRF